jgi:hypothetical protein
MQYTPENKTADESFIEYLSKEFGLNPETKQILRDNITFYNANVRSSNELFIPYEISKKLVDKILEENAKQKLENPTPKKTLEPWDLTSTVI